MSGSQPEIASEREVFILRLSRASQQNNVWRGQIEHVRSGQVRRLGTLAELAQSLELMLAETSEGWVEKPGLK